MGHSHDHHHGDRTQYYMEQLFTIGVCGAFAVVSLILWYTGALKIMLAEKFHIWVFLGAVALLLMAVINAVAVWFSVGEAKAVPVHDHDHDHAHSHDHHHHDHAHCDHDHGHEHVHAHTHTHEHAHAETGVQAPAAAALAVQPHAPAVAVAAAPAADHGHDHDGHEHGWAPWRYAVLLLPVAIYFVVPLEALSSTGGSAIDVDSSAVASTGEMKKEVSPVTFQQLEMAALYPENREQYEGETVALVGQYVPKDARTFTLRRFKISCCAADAVPLNAVILVDPKVKEDLDSGRLQGEWVQVTGRVEFLKRADGNGYTTALILTPSSDRPLFDPTGNNKDALVKKTKAPSNPYLN